MTDKASTSTKLLEELLLAEGLDDDTEIKEDMDATNVLDCDMSEIEYTSGKQLRAIKNYDATVELIGYVDAIEASKLVGEKQLRIYKFFLNNNAGDRVQVAVWRNEVQRFESVLKTNLIVHIDGVYAKPMLINNFNKGTINIEFVVQSNTVLNILGKHAIDKTSNVPDLIQLHEIGSAKKIYIKVQGFVKSNFAKIIKHTTQTGDYGCGSITDGEFKIEVRVSHMDSHEFRKGDHVEIRGEIQLNANPIYILTRSMNDIKKIGNERLTFKELLRGYKTIEKVLEENENEESQKKRLRTN